MAAVLLHALVFAALLTARPPPPRPVADHQAVDLVFALASPGAASAPLVQARSSAPEATAAADSPAPAEPSSTEATPPQTASAVSTSMRPAQPERAAEAPPPETQPAASDASSTQPAQAVPDEAAAPPPDHGGSEAFTAPAPPGQPPPQAVPEPQAASPPTPSPAPLPLPPRRIAPDIRRHAARAERTSSSAVRRAAPKPDARLATRAPSTPPTRENVPGLGEGQAAPAAPASQPDAKAAAQPVSGAWEQAIAAWLATHKSYPEEARREGKQGSIRIRFTVDRTGKVVDVLILRSTGSAVLDKAAEALLRGAELPAFPASMGQTDVALTVQLHYVLTQ